MGVPILASCGFRNMPPRYWPYSSVMATRWNRQQWSSWPRADCGSVIRADPYRLRRKKVGVPFWVPGKFVLRLSPEDHRAAACPGPVAR
jgi:hypothetical protein